MAFTKEASLYLVVSSGLLAILLTASRQFSWLDVSVSTVAMLPVVLGMCVGQHMRDNIAPETFKGRAYCGSGATTAKETAPQINT